MAGTIEPVRAAEPAEATVPAMVAPPPGNPRFPLFDSLRAVAAVSIVFIHAAVFTNVFRHASYAPLVAHLDVGVPIFFVISGFLLYRPMLAARILGTPRTPLHVYARRRFLRIAPAYWLALTALAIFPGIYGVFTGNWWVYYGLLQNLPLYTPTHDCKPLLTTAFNCGLSPAWSLTVEVLFYAVLPLFAFFMAWLTGRMRGRAWLAVELTVLTAFSAFSVWIQGFPWESKLFSYVFFSPLGRAWWFCLGMGLAALSVWIAQRGEAPSAIRWLGRHPGVPWILAIALYCLAAFALFEPIPSLAGPAVPIGEYRAEYILFGVVGFLVVLPAVFHERRASFPERVLGHRVIAWLGLISYGIFLWHYPIVYALAVKGHVTDWVPQLAYPIVLVLALAITVVCASASYYFVERPLMRLKYRRRPLERQAARESTILT